MSICRCILRLGLACWLSVLAVSPALADAQPDTVLKAVMIRKFVEFIKWPEAVAPQKDMHVKVCVLGESPMSQMTAVFAKTSASSPIRYSLKTIGDTGSADNCHMLFISSSQQAQLSSILASVNTKPILTVGDASGFAEKGGMIGFLMIDGKVRYNINNKSFGAAQLKVDAQLLEIANQVLE